MSFFTFERVAKGYAKYRPYYHPRIMEKIGSCTGLQGKFKTALDVGCGTGLSTIALQEIAEEVKGTDSSAEMIDVARSENINKIPFFNAPAENLPFEDKKFDILTVCGAINWIDRTQFFPEAKRVLNDKGWLIIYDNFITDEMHGNPNYTKWYQDSYLTRYPKPPRDESPLTETECISHGFSLVKNESYSNEMTLSIDQYIGFIMTQSNVIISIDSGVDDAATTKTWMQNTLNPLFPKNEGTFIFRGFIWYLQCA